MNIKLRFPSKEEKDPSETRYFVEDLDRDEAFRRRVGTVWSPKSSGLWYAGRNGAYCGPFHSRKAAVEALLAAVPEGPPWPSMPCGMGRVNVPNGDGELELTVTQSGRDGVPELNKVTVFDGAVRLGWVSWSPDTRDYLAERYPEGGDQRFDNQHDCFIFLAGNPRRLRS